jgi:magnesium-transporting ATPase (P-type)
MATRRAYCTGGLGEALNHHPSSIPFTSFQSTVSCLLTDVFHGVSTGSSKVLLGSVLPYHSTPHEMRAHAFSPKAWLVFCLDFLLLLFFSPAFIRIRSSSFRWQLLVSLRHVNPSQRLWAEMYRKQD